MIVEISDLLKKYGETVVVDGVDLRIEEGEIFGLLGPNGAGKSTTLNAILGLLKISSGSVSTKEVKAGIGYVPQELAFFEELSALDNVTYWGRLYGQRGSKLEEAVKEALILTGLWDRRKEKGKNYSGGMKRRLNIACAIVHKPRLLIMDEPTVGVDPQSRNNILEAIRYLNKNGTTVIYTSHYMEEIEVICSRVAIMDFGRIIAQGTVEELVDSVSKDNRIRMEFAKLSEEITGAVEPCEGIISVEKDGNTLYIRLEKEEKYLTGLLENLMEHHIKIKGMTLEKPNLETVFLQLTGKKLRD